MKIGAGVEVPSCSLPGRPFFSLPLEITPCPGKTQEGLDSKYSDRGQRAGLAGAAAGPQHCVCRLELGLRASLSQY